MVPSAVVDVADKHEVLHAHPHPFRHAVLADHYLPAAELLDMLFQDAPQTIQLWLARQPSNTGAAADAENHFATAEAALSRSSHSDPSDQNWT